MRRNFCAFSSSLFSKQQATSKRVYYATAKKFVARGRSSENIYVGHRARFIPKIIIICFSYNFATNSIINVIILVDFIFLNEDATHSNTTNSNTKNENDGFFNEKRRTVKRARSDFKRHARLNGADHFRQNRQQRNTSDGFIRR